MMIAGLVRDSRTESPKKRTHSDRLLRGYGEVVIT
jgi:hypothetical protein